MAPELASGSKLAAFGLTEPDAGSDAGATRTTAELRDGEWVVNGSKIFITNAGTDITACVTITARTGEDEISNLIVPNGAPGYVVSAPMKKLGWRASDTRELSFQTAACPEGNLLGPRGQGFQPVPRDPRRRPDLGRRDGRRARAGRIRPRGRLRARSAQQFGKPIAEFQAIQFKLADMATEIEAGRAARLQGRVAQGPGPAVRARGGDGEALRGRALEPRRRTGRCRSTAATASWTSRDLAPLPRPEDPRDRRGHERGAAHGHRAATSACEATSSLRARSRRSCFRRAHAHVTAPPTYLEDGSGPHSCFGAERATAPRGDPTRGHRANRASQSRGPPLRLPVGNFGPSGTRRDVWSGGRTAPTDSRRVPARRDKPTSRRAP